jgi:GxxExxY protein
MTENEIGRELLGCAFRVHSALGPGLLESVYETCLYRELTDSGFSVERQHPVPVSYKGEIIESGFRADLVVEQLVLVELKAVEKLLPVHVAQTVSYVRLANLKLGYLLNFNVAWLRTGIKRVANGL